MRVIVCNLQMFSNNQVIQVIDTNGHEVMTQRVEIDDMPRVISALASQNDIEKVILKGGVFCEPWAEEIKQTYTLNYGKNKNFEVEVV